MEKQKYDAHLVRTEEDVLICESVFSDVREDQIVPEDFLIKGVAIAGTRQSKNGYEYTDGAFNSLVLRSEGARVFLDHPSDKQIKDTQGVRPIKDFAGVFRHIKRDNDKVYGDFYSRESTFPLFKDIMKLRPEGVGMSINARVKIYKDKTGKEAVVEIDKLHSVDLVSSASLCSTLFESIDGDKLKETEKQEEIDVTARYENCEKLDFECSAIIEFIQRAGYEHSEVNRKINEGVIADQIKQDEIRMQTNRLIWKASDMVYDIIHDKEMPIKDKKENITKILDDLDDEIQKAIKKVNIKKVKPDKGGDKVTDESESLKVNIPTVKIDAVDNNKCEDITVTI